MSDLRDEIRLRMQMRKIGLRVVAAESGVGIAVISRCLNGRKLGEVNLEKLTNWIKGAKSVKKNPVSVKLLKVGKEVFLITIELLE